MYGTKKSTRLQLTNQLEIEDSQTIWALYVHVHVKGPRLFYCQPKFEEDGSDVIKV